MAFFDYKVVPAPRRMKKARGVSAHEELFALTLTDAINEHARQGWEYVRAETLTAEGPGGWFRRGGLEEQSVLVFRRERDTLGPRVAAAGETPKPAPAPGPVPGPAPGSAPAAVPAFAEGMPEAPRRRREPVVGEAASPTGPGARTPRPLPQLGPAERG